MAREAEIAPTLDEEVRSCVVRAVDRLCPACRRPEVALDDTDTETTLVRPGPSPEALAAGRVLGAAIRECLRAQMLPRRAAAVRHLQGHIVPQIAALLGWNDKKAENIRAGKLTVDTPFGSLPLPAHPALWANLVLIGEPR